MGLEGLIKNFDVPDIPKALVNLLDELSKEDYDLNVVKSYVESLPILNVKLFRILNSPLYSFKCEIKDIKQAIGLLGINNFKQLVLSILIFDMLNNLRKGNFNDKLEKIYKKMAVSAASVKCFSNDNLVFFSCIYCNIIDYLIIYNNKDFNLELLNYNDYLMLIKILKDKWNLNSEIIDIMINYYKIKFDIERNSELKDSIIIYASNIITDLLLVNGLREKEIDYLKNVVKLDFDKLLKLIEIIKSKLNEILYLLGLEENFDVNDFYNVFLKANLELKRLEESNRNLLDSLKEKNFVLKNLLTKLFVSIFVVENDELIFKNDTAKNEYKNIETIYDIECLLNINIKEELKNNYILRKKIKLKDRPYIYELILLKLDKNKILIAVENLTQEIRFKEMINKLKENIEIIANNTNSGLFVIDFNLKIKYASQNINKLFNKSIIGLKFIDIFDFLDNSKKILLRSLKEIKENLINEINLILKSINKKTNEIQTFNINIKKYIENNKFKGFYLVIQDISYLEKTKEELNILNKEKIKFNKIKNLISNLSDNLTVLNLSLDKIENNKKISIKDIKILQDSINKMNQIIEQARKIA